MQRSVVHLVSNGSKLAVGIVVARFNTEITAQMLAATKTFLAEAKVPAQQITVIDVPGSAELPLALQRLAKTKKYDCLIALGSVIRGETPHFEYVCAMAQQGVLRVSLDHSIPIGFGVITANDQKQAEARISLAAQAAAAALELTTKKF